MAASASDSLPPWRTRSAAAVQVVALPVDRHDVDQDAQGRGQVDAAAEQDAEIAAEQAGAIEPEDAGNARARARPRR